MASDVDAYARLVFYVAIGWSSLPFQAGVTGPKITTLLFVLANEIAILNVFV